MAWFRRKDDDMDPQRLLEQAHEMTPLEPVASAPGSFRMTVEDVFSITGRGTVVTGRVAAGTASIGATLRLTRVDGTTRDVRLTGIEAFRKKLDTASAGDNVGLLLPELGKTDIGSGDLLSA